MDSSDESIASGHHEVRPRRNGTEKQQSQHNPILNEEGNIIGWQRVNQDHDLRPGQNPPQEQREDRRRKGDTHSKVAETLQLITRELQSMKEEHQQSKIRELQEKLEKAQKKKRKSGELDNGYASDEELSQLKTGKLSYKTTENGLEKEITVPFKDDGDSIVSAEVRMLLARQPNGEPKLWWTKDFSQETLPRTGDNLYYDHVLQHKLNRTTVYKAHDPRTVPEIKEWSIKNSGYGRKMNTVYKFDANSDNGMELRSGAEMKDVTDMYELIDAGWNLMMITAQLRAHDYGPRAMMWTLHHNHMFVGPSKGDDKLQLWLVEAFMNVVITKNNARHKRGQEPMTIKECQEEAKSLVSLKHGDPALLRVGEIYSVIGKKNYNTNQQGQHQRGRNSPPNKGNTPANNRARELSQGNGGKLIKTTREKVQECCGAWNDVGGDTCTFGQGCTKDHKCNFVNEKGRVCWKRHPRCLHGKAPPNNPPANGPAQGEGN